ncbi:hypothetical protein E2562_015494 [Oryza meyeriana var. granulata]|uniref:Major facilitator superfamily (MFS) profile domain-containing protein n=1 Tax=Oryza meyeriana var. granulata TaxID=110450 RepID=A0A6G1BX48_9ORYZ|nr:hypothetical protein E2562_015494 [Oryza meyeriana var. granulata]
MYAFVLFFANFGPNSTTFILPTEIFPTCLRSTCHGISGAGGKIGAIIVGVVFTLALPESKGMSLEDITGEIEEEDDRTEEQSVVVVGAGFIHNVDL